MKVGVLGGGQLARMLALAGYPLEIELVCIDKNANSCASQVTQVFSSNFIDTHNIHEHFKNVKCVTYETENINLDFVKLIANDYTLHPSLEALRITQDRLVEKDFLNTLDIPTSGYARIDSLEDLQTFAQKYHYPFIIKTRTAGYDGKGQQLIKNADQLKEAWEKLGSVPLIAEAFVPFNYEVSLISVRNVQGEIAFYPLTFNTHENGILVLSQAPYVNDALESLAQQYATAVLNKLNYIGVMTIEFFCLGEKLIANEIAPRVHNSGHWTIEGAETSQFENHLRAILDLPLGSTQAKQHSAMVNIIGKKPDMRELLHIPGLHYHWYGKEPLPSRKVGHITLNLKEISQLHRHTENTLNLLK